MFWVLVIVGVVAGTWSCVYGYRNTSVKIKIVATVVLLISIALFIGSFFTAQGELYRLQLFATGKKGNWLVIDNSGGETLRHWILKKFYVKGSTQSDGWQFSDKDGNLCYVSGDAFVMNINGNLEIFLRTYREQFNIPDDLPTLE